MNNENFDLVQKLFELPWYNLILISLIIIPVFIGTWASLINSFSLNLNDKQKRTLSTTFIILYIIGVIVGKIGHNRLSWRRCLPPFLRCHVQALFLLVPCEVSITLPLSDQRIFVFPC